MYCSLPSQLALNSPLGATIYRRNMSKGRSAVHPVTVRPDSRVDDAVVQRQIEKLSLKGINVQLVEDEEEKWTTDQMIKSLPASLTVKRAVR